MLCLMPFAMEMFLVNHYSSSPSLYKGTLPRCQDFKIWMPNVKSMTFIVLSFECYFDHMKSFYTPYGGIIKKRFYISKVCNSLRLPLFQGKIEPHEPFFNPLLELFSSK